MTTTCRKCVSTLLEAQNISIPHEYNSTYCNLAVCCIDVVCTLLNVHMVYFILSTSNIVMSLCTGKVTNLPDN